MGLLYAQVARGQVILAEYSTEGTWNASLVALSLLEKLPPGDVKASYVAGVVWRSPQLMADDFKFRNPHANTASRP